MYQAKSFWNTPSVAPLQNSLIRAFSRDLVVLDCQPPSKIRIHVSVISAILFPWSRTVETLPTVSTQVLALDQFLPALMAAFIWRSIFRMLVRLVCEQYKGSGAGTASASVIVYPLSQGPIARQQQRHDVTLAGLVGILLRGRLKPADLECASQRVDLESPDGS